MQMMDTNYKWFNETTFQHLRLRHSVKAGCMPFFNECLLCARLDNVYLCIYACICVFKEWMKRLIQMYNRR